MRTVCACATARGGTSALIRLSGPEADTVAAAAGLGAPEPWALTSHTWQLSIGPVPCRALRQGARSYTGCPSWEITLPGAPDLVEIALECLCDAGAERAEAGEFTRQAVANNRLALDQAEALLGLAEAVDVAAAERAFAALRGGLGSEIAGHRAELITWRARVEAGLDFLDEADVRAFEPEAMGAALVGIADRLDRWLRAAGAQNEAPTVLLVGPANAGKSALFNQLTGGSALVSDIAGTTRDWLIAVWTVTGRSLRLIDTAGWLDGVAAERRSPGHRGPESLDSYAINAGKALLQSASLVVLCSAPDAPVPEPLPSDLAGVPLLHIATKADLPAASDQRASLAVSVIDGRGIERFEHLVGEAMAYSAGLPPRPTALLQQAVSRLRRLAQRLPGDEILAEELRLVCDDLADLVGETATDEVLADIFNRFCIGK